MGKAIDWNAKTWGVLPKTSPPEVLEALMPVFAWGVAVDSTALKRGVNAHKSHQQRRRERCDLTGGLHQHQQGHRAHGGLCACLEDFGCLHCFRTQLPQGSPGVLGFSIRL